MHVPIIALLIYFVFVIIIEANLDLSKLLYNWSTNPYKQGFPSSFHHLLWLIHA